MCVCGVMYMYMYDSSFQASVLVCLPICAHCLTVISAHRVASVIDYELPIGSLI